MVMLRLDLQVERFLNKKPLTFKEKMLRGTLSFVSLYVLMLIRYNIIIGLISKFLHLQAT